MKEIGYLDLTKHRYISADWVPYGTLCDCGRPAWRNLMVIGFSRHNKGGNFCWSCGINYISMISEMEEYKQWRRKEPVG